MKLTLNKKMLITLFISLICIFISQIAVRTLIELPELLKLEAASDIKDMQRVKTALSNHVKSHQTTAYDYAVWDDTYNFMELSSTDNSYQQYLLNNLLETSFKSIEIEGILILDTTNQVFHSGRYNPSTEEMMSTNHLTLAATDPSLIKQSSGQKFTETINSGIVESNIGPILFASSKILTSEKPYPESRGIFIYWSRLDINYFTELGKLLDIELTVFPVNTLAEDIGLTLKNNKLLNSENNILLRDDESNLYWNVTDNSGRPLLLVKQKADLRQFNPSIMSKSLIVGFAVSGLILVIISILFSRNIVYRLTLAKLRMTEITDTGNYKKYLTVNGQDQIDQMFDKFNQLLRYISSQDQILKRQNDSLEKMNKLDSLTGISNRRHMDEKLDKSWRQCMRLQESLTVLMIDIDYFKKYNDKYGHQLGDKVIREIAQALNKNIHRPTDHLSRYGGEEFLVILSNANKNQAIIVAERLLKVVETLQVKHEYSDCSKNVTISIGAATVVPDDKHSKSDLIKLADQALYKAKEHGRNNVYYLD